MGQENSYKSPATGLHSTHLQMVLKEEGVLHRGHHGPVPMSLGDIVAISFNTLQKLFCKFNLA